MARLNVTQPALSKRMQDLEAGLGVRLFERAKGRVYLTPAGQVFAVEARKLVDGFAGAVRDVQRTASGAPQLLSIGFNEQAMRFSPLTAALRAFRDRHPDIDVTVSLLGSATQLAAVRGGQLNVAILYVGGEDLASIASREIIQHDPYVIALPDDHPLAGNDKLSLKHLAGEDLIWPSEDSAPALHGELSRVWREAGIEPHVVVEIASAEAALNAVSAGFGVAVVRSSNAGREPAGVVLRPLVDLDLSTNLRIAWNGEAVTQPTRLFLDFLEKSGVTTAE
jgi:DNA-binding transcriptional LysR family regulator